MLEVTELYFNKAMILTAMNAFLEITSRSLKNSGFYFIIL